MKTNFKIIFFSVLLILSINLVYAVGVTGAIGNGITVIPRQNVGEGKEVTLDRELIVINKNNFRVNITLEPSREIKDIVELLDTSFPLEANQEKNARFKIIVKDNNEHSGKTNVYFKPNEGNGVVLASKLIILGDKVEGNTEENNNITDDNTIDNTIDNTVGNNVEKENNSNVSLKISGSATKTVKSSNINLSLVILILISLAIIGAIVGFIVLIKK